MRDEEREAPRGADEMIERGVRDGDAVVRGGSSPGSSSTTSDFGVASTAASTAEHVRHLLEKRGGAHREVIRGAHAGVHAVEDGELRGRGGDERAALRHDARERAGE